MYKRILTIQDISCLGQCSLTVALPIISACGHETCILPSGILSTHTGGFTGYTVHDLTDEFPKIIEHWKKENIKFDAIYTGYLGSVPQINYVEEIFKTLLAPNGKIIVDPAMADNGKLYYGFTDEYVLNMRKLCKLADVVLPNITEACFLTGKEYKEKYSADDVNILLKELEGIGAKNVVITGTVVNNEYGITIFENEKSEHFVHKKIEKSFHGTGDVYSSAFTGAYMQGKSLKESVEIAAKFTVSAIENTIDDDSHWYGVKFEKSLGLLCDLLNK